MKYLTYSLLLLLGAILLITSCKSEENLCTELTWYQDADGDGLGNPDEQLAACEAPTGYVADNTDPDDTGTVALNGSTPLSAFDEFNPDAVTISFDGEEITIESNGLPNHTSPYWESTNELHIEQVVGDHLTPGNIREGSYILTVSNAPEKAATSSATGLGAIGISVTGAPIFNDEERANEPLDINTAMGFDYAGGHRGPGGYHYHIESANVPENTTLSHDDEKLIGIMSDGFLLYGRKEMDGTYPTDLDESGGHYGETQHSNGEKFYHYHIINEFYINEYILLFGGDLQGTPNRIM